VKKVMVIGCPGSGKSTFSRELHRITRLPLYYLDMMYWNSDRSIVEKPVFLKRLNDALQCSEWIIDGNYGSTMELRLQACDTVFFLDYPTEICLDGIRERRGKPRPDMPWIEPADKEDAEFISFIKSYSVDSRPTVMQLLEKYKNREIHIFKDRTEAGEYLKKLKNNAP